MGQEDGGPSNWADLDKEEIASIASDDLYANRPNRWTGPKSTWRALTEDERTLWSTMKRVEDQNLGVHLYNSFALRKLGRDPATAQDVTVQLDNGQDAIWAPPQTWAAWPLAEGHLPTEEFVERRGEDEDERFTFRKKEVKMPSTDLQEELAASILRTAKKKFIKRKKRWSAIRPSAEDASAEEQDSDDEEEAESRATSAAPSRATSQNSDSDEDYERPSRPSTPRRIRKTARLYTPEISANDDLSYKLVGPGVRHILTQLDSTLQILHNTRVAPGYDSDSSTGESDDSNSQHSDRKKRPKGRPRKGPPQAPYKPSFGTKRVGRPRKIHLPKEGETYDDMLVRVARETHNRIPKPRKAPNLSLDDNLQDDGDPLEFVKNEGSEVITDDESQEDASLRKGEDGDPNEDTSDQGNPETADDFDAKFEEWYQRSKKFRRGNKLAGLRDWSDVLGAASLAGFSPEAIARTARRCADLFGEGMAIRTLHEVPASTTPGAGSAVQTVEYRPEPIQLSDSNAADSSSSSEEEKRLVAPIRRTTVSRSGTPFSRPSSPKSPSRSPSESRSRSRSASVGQQHLCPVPSCARALNGFSRGFNLKRHMTLVHGGMDAGDSGVAAGDVDSEDEVVGGVHVDGFLKAVVPSRGWRGEDMMTRKRKKTWGDKKLRSSESGSDY